jgi:hypothetical protein
MVPLSELIAKLPASANVKISRAWYELAQETLGVSFSVDHEAVESKQNPPQEQIIVESIDLSEEAE